MKLSHGRRTRRTSRNSTPRPIGGASSELLLQLEPRTLLSAAGSALPTFAPTADNLDRAEIVVSADLDHDGLADVVTSSGTDDVNADDDGSIDIFFNSGGLFRKAERYSLRDQSGDRLPGEIIDLALADVNGDSHIDIVALVGHAGRRIHVLLNDGFGAFGSQVFFSPDSADVGFDFFDSIALGQLTGDAAPEAVVTQSGTGRIYIFRNDGSGIFTFSAFKSTGSSPKDVVIADLDGDGDNDIAVSNYGEFDGRISLYRNTSTSPGTLLLSDRFDYQQIFSSLGAIANGDVTGDSKIDLVIAASDRLIILENRSDAQGFDFNTRTELPGSESSSQLGRPVDIAIGDVDHDGRLDIAAASQGVFGFTPNYVALFRGSGVGTQRRFKDIEHFELPDTGSHSPRIALTTLDGNDTLDLVYIAGDTRIGYAVYTGTGWALPTFAPLVEGYSPDVVATADLDHDGLADVVTGSSANGSEGFIHILFNSGGRFRSAERYLLHDESGTSLLGAINDLALADVNGDSHIDIVVLVGSGSQRRIHVLLNDGFGAFGSQVFFSPTDPAILDGDFGSLALGQLTGDAAPDAVVTQRGTDRIYIFRNDGEGHFTFSAFKATGSSPYGGVVITDLDGDGDNDIAVSNSGESSISLYRNTSTTPDTLLLSNRFDYQTSEFPQSLAAGDVAGDGKIDLVIAAGDRLIILENRSDAQGFDFNTRTDLPAGQPSYQIFYPREVAIGDVDHDGRLDIVAAAGYDSGSGGQNLVALFRASGTGSQRRFKDVEHFDLPTRSFFTSIALSTIDGDDTLDLVHIDGGYGRVGYAMYTGTGWALRTSAPLAKDDPAQVVLTADLDHDGLADVVTASGSNSTSDDGFINILFNSDGHFRKAIRYSLQDESGSPMLGRISDLALADVNGDSYIDIVVLVGSGSQRRIHVLLNDGLGAFGSQVFFSPTDPEVLAGDFDSLALGQLTGDAAPEAVVTQRGTNRIYIFRNDGEGHFTYSAFKVTGNSPWDVIVTDLDGDGDNDIAVSNSGESSISLYRNTSTNPGTLLLSNRFDFQTTSSPRAIAAADVAGDSKIDLVIATDNRLIILENRSDAQGFDFGTRTDLYDNDSFFPVDIAIGDIDNDGTLDIAVASWSTSSDSKFLMLLRGSGTGTQRRFKDVEMFGINLDSYSPRIALATIDSNTTLDLVFVDGYSDVGYAIDPWPGSETSGIDFDSAAALPLASRTGDGDMDGAISVSGNRDLYTFTTGSAAGRVYVQVVTPAGSPLNASVRILSAANEDPSSTIVFDPDGIPGVTASTSFEGQANTQYWIIVEGVGETIGSYTLSINSRPATNVLYFPEGFASDQIREFISIVNPGNTVANYTVTLRYETGGLETVISSGFVLPGARGGTTIIDGTNFQSPGIRKNTPYSVIITSDQPLGATLAHYDFGNAIGDSFTEQVSAAWNFARIERNPGGVLDFIVFYNPSPFSVDVTLTAYQTGSTPVSNTQTVGAQRRGGFSITDMPELPTGVLSVVLTARATSTSNQAAFEGIVASLSHYTADGSAGFGVLGDPDGGATSGAVTNLMQGATSRSEAVFFNPGSSTATVSITGSYLRGSLPEFTRTLTIVAGGQIVLTSADLGLTAEEPAGLRYTSTQPISVMSDVIQSGDADASTAAGVAGTRFLFGDAFMDPNLAGDKFFETLYIFNPAATTGNVTVKLEFTDGTSASFNVSVASRRFAEVKLHERPELTTRTGPTWFSMEISTGTVVGGGTPFMITLTHYDLLLGGGWATTPVPVGFVNDIARIPV